MLGRQFVVTAAFTHYVGAHSAVGYLGAHIDRPGEFFYGVQVFGEAFPVPFHTLVKCCARDVLHVFHYGDEAGLGFFIGLAGGETYATVAHDQSGNAVVGSRAAQWVPGGLSIHVGVHIYPTWGQQFALGVDFLLTTVAHFSHGDNFASRHCQVTGERGLASTVHYRCIANHQIVHNPYLLKIVRDSVLNSPVGA